MKHESGPDCPSCAAKLLQAHVNLIEWYLAIIKPEFPNAHVSWSYRDKEAQEACFVKGLTKLHFPNSAHNKLPAMALDLFQIDEQGRGVWSPAFYFEVSKLMLPSMIWGQNWKALGDQDHFQLRG